MYLPLKMLFLLIINFLGFFVDSLNESFFNTKLKSSSLITIKIFKENCRIFIGSTVVVVVATVVQ